MRGGKEEEKRKKRKGGKQEILITKTIGCSPFVFNHFLEKWKDAYAETGKGLTYKARSSQLPALKQRLEWLKEKEIA
ncbi:hypothetical protein NCCP28_17450 [Niallia sp. NCCP-28]|nr:hypothetical protein NCCP28_17450 [Niallia sp. NCCP-28]